MKKVAIIEMEDFHNSYNECKIIKVCNFKDIGLKLDKNSKLYFFEYGYVYIPNTSYRMLLIETYNKWECFSEFLKNLQKFERKEKLKNLMIC